MTKPYTLYGSYASYYTAKTRSYLRKKGIAFVERLPSDPAFREEVRPASGTARIPQVRTPDGEIVQDSVEILDTLEARFPDLPALPSTPRQRIFVHLMELLASEGLVKLAWLHRWIFEEENLFFVKMDFGRSFKPQGTDEELMKYGNIIADRMTTRGMLPKATDELKASIDQQYLGLLSRMETHLQHHPYFLGGHPSAADYSIMGALHAHLGRDPAGLSLMQRNAPRVFRWVEHMIVPEVQSPEFSDRAIEYPANDDVPETALEVLRYIGQQFGEDFVLGALAFNQAVASMSPQSGFVFDEEFDQPALASETVEYQGHSHEVRAQLYHIWLLQRTQKFFCSLSTDQQSSVVDMLGNRILVDLACTHMAAELERVKNRLRVV